LDSVVTSTVWVPRVIAPPVALPDPAALDAPAAPDALDDDELQAASPAVSPAAEATARKDLRDIGSRKRPRWIALTIRASFDSGIRFAPLVTNFRADFGMT
jgi:hypothetical protein